MSRRLRYQVAVSLDGFIAGPNGEYDWIVMDPSIDFAALFKEFDTAVMGRKTYEVLTAQVGPSGRGNPRKIHTWLVFTAFGARHLGQPTVSLPARSGHRPRLSGRHKTATRLWQGL